MKKFVFVLFTLTLSFTLHGQSIERWVLASGSGSGSSGPNLYHEFTIGEAVVSTLTASNLVVTQGFKQPFTLSIITDVRPEDALSQVKVWPNPAVNELHIRVQDALEGNYFFELFDVGGNKVWSQTSKSPGQSDMNVTMQFEGLTDGSYFLTICSGNTILSTHKLIIQNQ